MAIPKKVEYIIIGAGIHGLSTAWHLALKLKAKGKAKGNAKENIKERNIFKHSYVMLISMVLIGRGRWMDERD